MKEHIFKREKYLNKLVSKIDNRLIKIITGIRRCGKSYLVFKLFKNYLLSHNWNEEQIIEIKLDFFSNIKYQDPNEFLNYVYSNTKKDSKYILLVDEIQLLGNFVAVLNELSDNEKYDIYITGSNSRFLSKDIETEFRGRGDVINLFPLSFKEVWEVQKDNKSIEKIWEEYFLFGGIPLVNKMEDDYDKAEYLRRLFNETYIKDIIERNNLTKALVINQLTDVIASNIGSLTNLSKICNTFNSVNKTNVTAHTLSKYIEYLKDSFLIEEVNRFDIKGRKYIKNIFKFYFVDPGLRNTRLNFRQNEENHIMENIIFNELKNRGYNVDVGLVISRNAQEYKQYEVDFVAQKHNQKIYVQSALNLDDPSKLAQETNSLLSLNDFFKKIVVVKNYSKTRIDQNGIIYMGLFDFLLSEEL
ncbi:ATP-binding protein [Mycoplasmopsis gallinacea]|uniref:Putative ATPase, AAA+ superfamily n=1 Tax=Mycoplasmopsis gallinacea TaxID=29556 RepID=A0A449A3U2_9BACT|nr:ATP-binding protein [Mycoplasmopsis gallinacea]VEU58921.1 putative ATPase, AAA+ superfamily [Mycoplasmopsis gallinacea]